MVQYWRGRLVAFQTLSSTPRPSSKRQQVALEWKILPRKQVHSTRRLQGQGIVDPTPDTHARKRKRGVAEVSSNFSHPHFFFRRTPRTLEVAFHGDSR